MPFGKANNLILVSDNKNGCFGVSDVVLKHHVETEGGHAGGGNASNSTAVGRMRAVLTVPEGRVSLIVAEVKFWLESLLDFFGLLLLSSFTKQCIGSPWLWPRKMFPFNPCLARKGRRMNCSKDFSGRDGERSQRVLKELALLACIDNSLNPIIAS